MVFGEQVLNPVGSGNSRPTSFCLIEWLSWAKRTLGGFFYSPRYLSAYSERIESFTSYLKGQLDIEIFLKSVKECELQQG
jgi:hypothetical protein